MNTPALIDTALERVVGQGAAKKLASIGLKTVGELLDYYPRRYAHWGKLTPLTSVHEGEDVTLLAQVVSADLIPNRRRGVRLSVELTDGFGTINATFFAQHPGRLSVHQRLLQPGSQHLFAGKISLYRGRHQLTHPEFEGLEDDAQAAERALRPIPIYAASSRCPSWLIAKSSAIVIDLLRATDISDPLTDAIRKRFDLIPLLSALKQIHQPSTDEDVTRAKTTLRWVEALELQTALLARRAQANARTAAAIATEGGTAVAEARSQLPFTLTDGQDQALRQILTDMSRPHPMQRLLQADVGAGKTVVAGLAMTAVVDAGYQAALLAPTEVLAEQHARSLRRMLPVPVELLTGSSATLTRKKVQELASMAQPAIFVGTHALLQSTVDFTGLGLIVIDEQHRFGVAQREKLREGLAVVPHLLTMTATPIPRTIAMTVFGDLDITAIRELPSGRKTVETFVVDAANKRWMERMWQRAAEEIASGGRVFVVVPRIETATSDDSDLANVEDTYRELTALNTLSHLSIGMLHGRMPAEEKARTIDAFNAGNYQLLVTTTVIEVGVDIQAASMMVILDAQQFGLSQLHQLRGRVGRGGQQAVCMAVHRENAAEDSLKRLRVFASTSDGFELAEADLDLRREGDVLGDSQSGRTSSLKALRVVRDARIIERARSVAEEIVAKDPHLEAHPGLKQRVERADSRANWLERT
ncbi:MAG: ATP-dependent DNA helicase RecG [Actinomycetaceae bacterium]|nr:ATP-dependent DNA helicase RecG [Actinomycetaceae bacterium]